MKISSFITISFLLLSGSLDAQTLFTYGKEKVASDEFKAAYQKANPDKKLNEKPVREYLSLYINSRLKIEEAYERKYDTLPEFRDELASLRQQVMENYMTDEKTYNRLLQEAFDRSQKDIRIQHIYIPYATGVNGSDSLSARQRIREAYMQLNSGTPFEEVAAKYSLDPSVAENKGDLGYISVFALPYEFENIVYNLQPGKYSEPYKSDMAYHIFKNTGERKARGKITVAQILLAVPPGSGEDEIKRLNSLADSLYQLLKNGANFGYLVTTFSNDYVSAAKAGIIPEFAPGTYDPVFENHAYALTADGEISRPFSTSHGIHIIKRVSLTSSPAEGDKITMDRLRSQLERDPRINIAREKLYEEVFAKAGLKEADIDKSLLKKYTDSAAYNRPAPAGAAFKEDEIIFKLGEITKNIAAFTQYVQTNIIQPGATKPKSFDELYSDFKKQTALEYYRKHLEDFNMEFRNQMKELKDGNLFFDIMMKEVWEPAQTDTAGQLNYYRANQSKYKWQHSADAVIFYCNNEETASELSKAVSEDPENWRTELSAFSDRASSDSGRFELSRLPGLKKQKAAEKMITLPEKNIDDNSASFSYIFKIYNEPAAKSFMEAKNEVITDFQQDIDNRWIAALKKKYPVKINERVLKSLYR